MTVQELLKPRYKVIADYPDSSFPVGQIVNFVLLKTGDWVYRWAKYDGMYEMGLLEFQEYPHLFKKLEWYEERSIDDMPEYVKDNKRVLKVAHPSQNFRIWHQENEIEMRFIYPENTHKFLPATEQEYLNYIS